MRKSKYFLVFALLAAILSFPAAQSLAYFTTYATAQGGHPLYLGWDTQLEEDVDGNVKTVRVKNTGETDCYVRVRAYTGEFVKLSFSGDEKWIDGGDGWFYYDGLVPAHGQTEDLIITITPDKEHLDADYDVIVMHESAPPAYDADGNLLPSTDPAVWTRDVVKE